MLADMKVYKQLLRKALNLIQGMEMMNQVLDSVSSTLLLLLHSPPQGYMHAVGGGGGGEGGGSSPTGPSPLTSALCKRSSFIALRRAIYTSTIQVGWEEIG